MSATARVPPSASMTWAAVRSGFLVIMRSAIQKLLRACKITCYKFYGYHQWGPDMATDEDLARGIHRLLRETSGEAFTAGAVEIYARHINYLYSAHVQYGGDSEQYRMISRASLRERARELAELRDFCEDMKT